jgi:rhodanese-related sulfurtransferase
MREKYKQISSAETPVILQQGAAIVDIRRPEEWQLTGTVADSILLTFFDAAGNSDPAGWLQQLNRQVAADVPLVLL